jgi:hypothetical protein
MRSKGLRRRFPARFRRGRKKIPGAVFGPASRFAARALRRHGDARKRLPGERAGAVRGGWNAAVIEAPSMAAKKEVGERFFRV